MVQVLIVPYLVCRQSEEVSEGMEVLVFPRLISPDFKEGIRSVSRSCTDCNTPHFVNRPYDLLSVTAIFM